ncbi:uncharacterized protein LOC118782723 [Megalops cyprinoides]|uniref:uncharacterized protein LOC118782723 n=1 Tax=Megalops cyprinoides TaxID=118141 RepID=UPI0018651D47|nr:uncharacterized protein LOC118782723 [Megalops cyprinoides]
MRNLLIVTCCLIGECEWPNRNIQIKTEEGQIRARKGRFSLYDDRTARVFAVTITGLTLEDAGTYWCGIRGLLMDVFSKVELIVKRAPLPTQTPAATPTPPPGATEGGAYSTAASLDDGLTTLMYITYSSCRRRNPRSGIMGSLQPTDKAQAEYEEIKDSNQQPHADTAINTIYCTASSPKDSSDSLNYATINFPKSPDSEDQSAITLTKDSTEYSTVSFHTDPPNSDIYSTIFNGNSDRSPLMGIHCGSILPSPFVSDSNALTVVSYWDNIAYRPRFIATYRMIDIPPQRTKRFLPI